MEISTEAMIKRLAVIAACLFFFSHIALADATEMTFTMSGFDQDDFVAVRQQTMETVASRLSLCGIENYTIRISTDAKLSIKFQNLAEKTLPGIYRILLSKNLITFHMVSIAGQSENKAKLKARAAGYQKIFPMQPMANDPAEKTQYILCNGIAVFGTPHVKNVEILPDEDKDKKRVKINMTDYGTRKFSRCWRKLVEKPFVAVMGDRVHGRVFRFGALKDNSIELLEAIPHKEATLLKHVITAGRSLPQLNIVSRK